MDLIFLPALAGSDLLGLDEMVSLAASGNMAIDVVATEGEGGALEKRLRLGRKVVDLSFYAAKERARAGLLASLKAAEIAALVQAPGGALFKVPRVYWFVTNEVSANRLSLPPGCSSAIAYLDDCPLVADRSQLSAWIAAAHPTGFRSQLAPAEGPRRIGRRPGSGKFMRSDPRYVERMRELIEDGKAGSIGPAPSSLWDRSARTRRHLLARSSMPHCRSDRFPQLSR